MDKIRHFSLAVTCMMALTYTNAQDMGGQIRQDLGDIQRQVNCHCGVPNGRNRHLSDRDFSLLYNKVKKASFDDNKYDLLEVANLGCHYSCRQTARIISIFSFTDNKLKALKLMAPRITDLHNAAEIYKQFTFSIDKDKAAEIIQNSCRQ